MSWTIAGRTALITGASSGIGAAFAAALAERGADLVLVARRQDRLETLADDIRNRYGVAVTTLAIDLAQPGVGLRLLRELDDRDITVHTLVNNAGFGTYGTFVDEDAERIASEIHLNIATVVDLTRTFLPGMLAAGSGTVVNLASTAAFQAVPQMAVYSASKAFVLHFTEALESETRGSGVTVLALCPGATKTEFFDVVGTEDAAAGRMESPQDVVSTALRMLDRRRTSAVVVSGAANRFGAIMAGMAPRRLAVAISARMVSGG